MVGQNKNQTTRATSQHESKLLKIDFITIHIIFFIKLYNIVNIKNFRKCDKKHI